MKFTFVTLFPNLIEPYFHDSILKRAVDSNCINYEFYNPRDFTTNKHKKVDDQMVGGGAGMLLFCQPLFDCLDEIKRKDEDAYIIFPLAAAKPFKQNDAKRLATKKNIVFVSGRYEGIDERALENIVTDFVSIGDYVLTGGELPAMVVIDTVSRLVPGVLNNEESAETESFSDGLLEYPQYTRPADYNGKAVPEVLLSGHHANIEKWRHEKSLERTKKYRPDLYETYVKEHPDEFR